MRFIWICPDLSGLVQIYHGIHESPGYLGEKSLEKNMVSQRKNKQLSLKIPV